MPWRKILSRTELNRITTGPPVLSDRWVNNFFGKVQRPTRKASLPEKDNSNDRDLGVGRLNSGTLAEDMVIEEVVVTAQKREQRLQDVPVAVTALTAETIETSGIRETADLTRASASLTYGRARHQIVPHSEFVELVLMSSAWDLNLA